ncbi:phosphoribosylformylglycinamidine synthase [Flavobacterium sp. J372]|uniref:HAEPLYID family protein n=1 Tax=Flavobacterium sp. J372 TaxID=2898436 RepID=UPI002151DC2B|nr:HAEPLYID family protein [Flavobacterium sp. J372]MCR5862378.1 phosphoribosylformylglycinamidine synthase [Flavobacterium sp. J372]
MKNMFRMALLAVLFAVQIVSAQDNTVIDSLYIHEVEERKDPPKVLHAEPLFIDLIRDLGARKGEKEWNVGLGLADNNTYDQYTALVEYEWAPIDRLGLEVELPFSFHYPMEGAANVPGNRLNSLKLAGQYSFFVNEKISTSMAIGYIHEFELSDFSHYGKGRLFTGNVYNPFFIAAKRWGQNFHTLLYTGPQFFHHFEGNSMHTVWQINSNVHYMIPGTRNFVGIEFNKEVTKHDFEMTIRPQMRVGIADNLLIGIVTGVPIKRENERFSSFLRLIYEPGH